MRRGPAVLAADGAALALVYLVQARIPVVNADLRGAASDERRRMGSVCNGT